jgi:hypothetical protein
VWGLANLINIFNPELIVMVVVYQTSVICCLSQPSRQLERAYKEAFQAVRFASAELGRNSGCSMLLSAGVDFESFRKQVKIACKAGASGFLAGRALWQEGTQIRSRDERMIFSRIRLLQG